MPQANAKCLEVQLQYPKTHLFLGTIEKPPVQVVPSENFRPQGTVRAGREIVVFPEIRGIDFFEGRHNDDHSILGIYIGIPPIQGNYNFIQRLVTPKAYKGLFPVLGADSFSESSPATYCRK